jgi:hypothetical protein
MLLNIITIILHDQIAYEVVWNKDEYKVKLLDLRG